MRLDKRVADLEARSPRKSVTVHLVGVMAGQTEEDALADYGRPIPDEDELIFLVGMAPK